MKRLWYGIAAALICTAWMTACNKDGGITSDVATRGSQNLVERGRNPSVSGHVELDSLGEGRSQQYSFTAVMHKDGSVKGQFQLFDLFGDSTRLVAHGDVECFTIQDDGKTAWLGGVIRHGVLDTMNLVGAEAYWTVMDNGEGSKAEPDSATEIVYGFDGLLADDHCSGSGL